MNRRNFLKISGLGSASLLLPQFIRSSYGQISSNIENILVVIQLSGGNDGLNTIIPFNQDLYYKLRPSVAIAKKDMIIVNDHVAFHPNLKNISSLFEDGYVSVLNNVGYPNPNRSHFRAMDIWHSASSSNEYLPNGWIGRYLDSTCRTGDCQSLNGIELNESLSLAMKGNIVSGLAIKNPDSFYLTAQEPFFKSLALQRSSNEHAELNYLRKTFVQATESAQYIYDKAQVKSYDHPYPDEDFAKRLKIIASLIKAESQTKIYYISMSGFDTHAFQTNIHDKLMKKYDAAVGAFVSDLKKSGHFNRTSIFTFSEFGRRVAQNASRGTDHGTANNVFIISQKLRQKGFIGSMPDLSQLDETGDILYQIDFRQIYASLLIQWLKAEADKIIPKNMNPLSIFTE